MEPIDRSTNLVKTRLFVELALKRIERYYMNYLQYIHSVYQPTGAGTGIRYLVSGVDFRVRQVLGQYIVNSVYDSGKVLFVLDSTQSGSEFTNFGRFQVMNPLNGDVDLCHDLLEVSSLKEISRLRSLLMDLGFEGTKAMKVVSYLSFVKEIERRLGNNVPLRIETLEEYGGTALVKWKLLHLVENGKLSNESYEYLLSRYAEVSSAAADFEMFLVMLAPFLSGAYQPSAGTAVHLTVGEFAADRPMQQMLCKLMISFVKKQPSACSILIVDDGKSDRSCIIDVLKTIPTATDVHLLTTDAFSLSEEDLSVLMGTFPVRIYSRHDTMSSCAKIEASCGSIDVVKRSYTTTIDKRIRASTAFDMLLGTNRTEAEICNAPVREARYRKEIINSLCPSAAIIDCGGTQALFQF